MELFGLEIKRKSGDETKAQSFVPPQNDGSVIEIGKDQGMGGFASTGGVIGQYVDMEGGVKNEADLVTRYRTMSLVPECDAAIEDIVNESISSNDFANQNRLSISVNVDFKNYINEKENYNQNFTRYVDYKSDQNLEEIESELTDQILEEICIDIFNKTFVNW